jgi:putative peptide zinc metalloprotease protein
MATYLLGRLRSWRGEFEESTALLDEVIAADTAVMGDEACFWAIAQSAENLHNLGQTVVDATWSGLKFRVTLLSELTTRAATKLFKPLFAPVLVVLVLAALAAFDVWLFLVHGLGEGLRQTVEQPIIFLFVVACVIVSAALHEFGHAAACSYGGARPGRMGAGIYVAWPAFYTDVTDAYRLDRRGRLRTDLGGVYFNALVVLGAGGAYLATRYEPLLLVCFVLQMQIVQQMLPLLRLDGYYVLSDLVGVPDLFKRIGPILRSALPWRPAHPLVTELKPKARAVVTLWVLAVVPLLLVNLAFIVFQAPRIVATAWDSAARQWGIVTTASGLALAVGVLQLVILMIPTLGAAITMVRVGRRAGTGAWAWSAGSPGRRFSVLGSAGLLAAVLVVAWWPDGQLTPFREGERGTVQQGVVDAAKFRQGSPLLRSPREAQQPLPPAPAGRSAVGDADRTGSPGKREPGSQPSSTSSPPPTSSPSPSGSSSPTSSATPSASPTPSSSGSTSVSPTPTTTTTTAQPTP